MCAFPKRLQDLFAGKNVGRDRERGVGVSVLKSVGPTISLHLERERERDLAAKWLRVMMARSN